MTSKMGTKAALLLLLLSLLICKNNVLGVQYWPVTGTRMHVKLSICVDELPKELMLPSSKMLRPLDP